MRACFLSKIPRFSLCHIYIMSRYPAPGYEVWQGRNPILVRSLARTNRDEGHGQYHSAMVRKYHICYHVLSNFRYLLGYQGRVRTCRSICATSSTLRSRPALHHHAASPICSALSPGRPDRGSEGEGAMAPRADT